MAWSLIFYLVYNNPRFIYTPLYTSLPKLAFDHQHKVLLQVVLPLSEEADKRSGARPQQDLKKHPERGHPVEGVTGEALAVRKAPDEEAVRHNLQVKSLQQPFTICKLQRGWAFGWCKG